MNQQEKKLIEAIKAKAGYQVFLGSMGGCVRIVRNTKSSVGQQSVWLGRKDTIADLERIIAA